MRAHDSMPSHAWSLVPSEAARACGLTSADDCGWPIALELDAADAELESTTVRSEAEAPARGLLGASVWQMLAKRAIDVLGSTLSLALLAPLLLAVAVAVRLSSRGPILYRQRRVGLEGAEFTMLKFRSMRVGAHDLRHVHAHANEATGPVFKIREDPRVTGVGR